MIPISEKEQDNVKEIEEKLRRKVTAEFKKTHTGKRKKAGLILSAIGGILYLISGILLFGAGWGFGDLSTPYLTIGIISLVGIGIGAYSKKIRIGGIVILISIPISIVILVISNWAFLYVIIIILVPLPFGIPGVFVIIGGILWVKSSDE